jgi:hypothetical protein
MLELLKKRSLFKRVVVFSATRKEDAVIWQNLHDFRRGRRPTWKWMRALQANFQQRITASVSENPNPSHQTSVVSADARNKFISDAVNKVLVLVDVPPEREGSDTELEYLREEDRRRYKVDEVETGSLEESVVWAQLKNNAQQSIAKVRIFCHPEHHEFLSNYLDHEQIRGQLDKALADTTSEA